MAYPSLRPRLPLCACAPCAAMCRVAWTKAADKEGTGGARQGPPGVATIWLYPTIFNRAAQTCTNGHFWYLQLLHLYAWRDIESWFHAEHGRERSLQCCQVRGGRSSLIPRLPTCSTLCTRTSNTSRPVFWYTQPRASYVRIWDPDPTSTVPSSNQIAY